MLKVFVLVLGAYGGLPGDRREQGTHPTRAALGRAKAWLQIAVHEPEGGGQEISSYTLEDALAEELMARQRTPPLAI